MKQFFIVFLFLVTFVSARAVEVTCFCMDDVTTHHESKSKTEKDKDEHCQHICSQCHFAAVIPLKVFISIPGSMPEKNVPVLTQFPKQVPTAVYRPPIS